jgi:dimethylargininase
MDRGLTTQSLGHPDLSIARRQHTEYVRVLRSLGVEVTVLESADDLPDSHFVEDTAVVHRGTAILTRPGAPERQPEVDLIRPHLERHLPVLVALAFIASGDYMSLIRQLRLFF